MLGSASSIHGIGVGDRQLIDALCPTEIVNVTFHAIRRIRTILGRTLLGVYGQTTGFHGFWTSVGGY